MECSTIQKVLRIGGEGIPIKEIVDTLKEIGLDGIKNNMGELFLQLDLSLEKDRLLEEKELYVALHDALSQWVVRKGNANIITLVDVFKSCKFRGFAECLENKYIKRNLENKKGPIPNYSGSPLPNYSLNTTLHNCNQNPVLEACKTVTTNKELQFAITAKFEIWNGDSKVKTVLPPIPAYHEHKGLKIPTTAVQGQYCRNIPAPADQGENTRHISIKTKRGLETRITPAPADEGQDASHIVPPADEGQEASHIVPPAASGQEVYNISTPADQGQEATSVPKLLLSLDWFKISHVLKMETSSATRKEQDFRAYHNWVVTLYLLIIFLCSIVTILVPTLISWYWGNDKQISNFKTNTAVSDIPSTIIYTYSTDADKEFSTLATTLDPKPNSIFVKPDVPCEIRTLTVYSYHHYLENSIDFLKGDNLCINLTIISQNISSWEIENNLLNTHKVRYLAVGGNLTIRGFRNILKQMPLVEELTLRHERGDYCNNDDLLFEKLQLEFPNLKILTIQMLEGCESKLEVISLCFNMDAIQYFIYSGDLSHNSLSQLYNILLRSNNTLEEIGFTSNDTLHYTLFDFDKEQTFTKLRVIFLNLVEDLIAPSEINLISSTFNRIFPNLEIFTLAHGWVDQMQFSKILLCEHLKSVKMKMIIREWYDQIAIIFPPFLENLDVKIYTDEQGKCQKAEYLKSKLYLSSVSKDTNVCFKCFTSHEKVGDECVWFFQANHNAF